MPFTEVTTLAGTWIPTLSELFTIRSTSSVASTRHPSQKAVLVTGISAGGTTASVSRSQWAIVARITCDPDPHKYRQQFVRGDNRLDLA